MASRQTQGQRHDRIDPTADSRPVDNETSLSQKMLSATTGSILTSLLVTPLDVVRVRLQAQTAPSPLTRLPSFIQLPPDLGVSACCREVFWVQNQSQFCVAAPNAAVLPNVVSECAAEETQRRTFNSTMDGLRKIARNEGMTTLWRGLSPTLAMSVPGNVIYFAGYDWLRTSAKSPMNGRISDAYAPLVAGSFARVLSAFAVSPIEMLRTRMQAASTTDKNVLRATIGGLQRMVLEEGYTSLWRGLTLTLWRDVPFSAFYWWGYEYGRERLRESRLQRGAGLQRSNELTHSAVLVDSFLAGAASGAIAAFVTTPFDVGKTRQQIVLHEKGVNLKSLPENQTMPRFLWRIYRTEGTAGLFKGWAARCLKVAPACAIMISSYEIGKKMAVMVNDRGDIDV